MPLHSSGPFTNSRALAQSTWTQVVGFDDDQAALWDYAPDTSCGDGSWSQTLLPTQSGRSSVALAISDNDTSVFASTDAIIVGYEEDSGGVRYATVWQHDTLSWARSAVTITGSTSTECIGVTVGGSVLIRDTYTSGSSTVEDYYIYSIDCDKPAVKFSTANVSGLATGETIEVVDIIDSRRLAGTRTTATNVKRAVILEDFCPSDVDGDGDVAIGDLITLLANWAGHTCYDLDLDGLVGFSDLLVLLSDWGDCIGAAGAIDPDITDCLNASTDPMRQLDCIEALLLLSTGG